MFLNLKITIANIMIIPMMTIASFVFFFMFFVVVCRECLNMLLFVVGYEVCCL